MELEDNHEYQVRRIWKLSVFACFKIQSCHSPRETKENKNKFHTFQWPSQNSYHVSSELKYKVLLLNMPAWCYQHKQTRMTWSNSKFVLLYCLCQHTFMFDSLKGLWQWETHYTNNTNMLDSTRFRYKPNKPQLRASAIWRASKH
jgi:hypothetical protein